MTVSPRNDVLATAPEVAAFLGISVVTMAQWRQQGRGPKWAKVGRWVRYDWAEVQSWVAAGGDRDA